MIESVGLIGNVNKSQHIHIIGAGISGLVLGHYLKRLDYSFTIYEQGARAGGKISTIHGQYGLIETAANAIYTNDDVYELIDKLGLSVQEAKPKLKKVVWRAARAMSPPVKKREILRILFNLFKTPDVGQNTTIYEFFVPLVGKPVCEEVIAPVFAGIYAEDIKDLHFKSIFKNYNKPVSYYHYFKQLKKEKAKQKHPVRSISFDGGMQVFIDALANELKENIIYNCKDKLIKDNVIICTSAPAAAKYVISIAPELSKTLNSIKYNSISTITIICEREISFLNKAFGILFPPDDPSRATLGILANDQIFNARTKDDQHFSYTFILKHTELDPKIIKEELEKIREFDTYDSILEIKLTKWREGLPIYNNERHQNILKLRAQVLNIKNNIAFFGNYVDGISIREIISHAKAFASKF